MIARVAVPDDCAGVIDIALQFEPYTPTPEHVAMLFEMASTCGGMFVAVDDGDCWCCDGHGRMDWEDGCNVCHGSGEQETVIGFLCALLLPHPFTGRPYVNVVAWWVPEEHRKTGAGLALLRLLLRWCSTQPLDMVRMATPLSSHLDTFLHKCGFKPVEIGWLKGSTWL